MPLTRTVLHEEIWEATGTDSSDYDTIVLDRMLNLSWWEVSDKLGFREKEGEANLITTAGIRNYDVTAISSDLESLQKVAVLEDSTSQWAPLSQKDFEWFQVNREDDTEARGLPENYARYGSELFLHPTPDATYSIKIKYLKTLEDLQTSGFSVPQVWHEIICLGAQARVWHRLGDPARRDDTFRLRDAMVLGMTDVKVKENVSKTSAISLLFAPYP